MDDFTYVTNHNTLFIDFFENGDSFNGIIEKVPKTNFIVVKKFFIKNNI